jgi:hypothetical protein
LQLSSTKIPQMSEQLIAPSPTQFPPMRSRVTLVRLKAGVLTGSYQNDADYRKRISRHLKRKSAKRADYFARSFSGEQYTLRAFTVFHRAVALARETSGLALTFRTLLFLLIAKYYLTHSGKDYFFAGQVGQFSNSLLWKQYSIRNASVLCNTLQRLNYLNTTNTKNGERIKYVLSMKARSFFRDLDQQFKAIKIESA